MLSLLNRSRGKSEDGVLVWHPNFRNKAQLPDTKTVRTKFFVNMVAVTVMIGLFLFVAVRELKLASLRSELADIEREIGETTKPSAKAVADFKLYQQEEKQFNEAYAFVKDPFRYPDFLMQLASTLPIGVKIKKVDFRSSGSVLNVSGSVRGSDAAASDVASEFVKKLQGDADFAKYFSSITLLNLGRNVAEGSMSFDLSFKFKVAGKEPVKK